MSPAGGVEVRPEALESPVAQELIGELNAELSLQYPPSHAILSALEEEAGRLGARRVVLETGVRQEAALGLYPSAGYERIPPFGPYVASPASVCFAKDLAPLPG